VPGRHLLSLLHPVRRPAPRTAWATWACWATRTAAAALLLVSAGCESRSPPNLVLITLDTTRADHLGAYGYGRDTSPALDALAAESALFERAFSHVPVTLPAHTSILTGHLPTAHGIRDNGRFIVPEELETLPEILGRQGYATAAFVSGFVLDSRFGLDQGFDTYDDSFTEEWSEEKLRDARIYNQMVTDRPADQTTDRALVWLREHDDGPFFIWVHYYDPHQRYAPPRPYDQLFHDSPYDGEIAFMDSQIERLFSFLGEAELWENTAIVVTGDHGESLGQHGEATHAVLSYDSTLRVPLIVKAPAPTPAPRRVAQSTSHVDLQPTMLEMLGLPEHEGAGRSLVPALEGRGGAAARQSYFECALPRFSFGWEPLFGLRADGWKYIHAPEPELYDLSSDPNELYNLARSQPEKRDDLEALLFRTIADNPPLAVDSTRGEMTEDVRQRLSALGYFGGSSTSVADLNAREPSGRRSPNDGVVYLSDYYLANSLAGWGRLREAAEIYRSALLPLDPENPIFLTTLANLERRLGRAEQAFTLYRRAQVVDPSDATTLVALAQLESDRGATDAARELLAAAREVAPEDLTAAYLEAELASRQDRSDEAISGYRRALAIDGTHRDSLIGIGVALAKAGQTEEARRQLGAALDIAPFSARAHYNLGLLELNAGNAETAAGAFERALRYQRPYPAASLGLAMALIEQGDDDAAELELEQLISEARQETALERARELLATLRSP